jgi:hypothetical protein
MVNISTAIRGHYGNDGYLWAIIIRRFCDIPPGTRRFYRRNQPRRNGTHSSSRQTGQATRSWWQIWSSQEFTGCSMKKGSRQATHGMQTTCVASTHSIFPLEGCNFFPFFLNIKKGFALFFLTKEAFARRCEVFLMRRSFVPH